MHDLFDFKREVITAMFEEVPSQKAILEYEVAASWWARDAGWRPLQNLASWYFAWKVKRKYSRYLSSIESAKRLRRAQQLSDVLFSDDGEG